MKIVYVVPFKVMIPSKAAHTVNIMNMCGAMTELGHDVTLILPECAEAKSSDIFSTYGVKPFRVLRVRSFQSKWLYPVYSLIVLREISMIRPDLVVGRSAMTCFMAVLSGYKTIFDSHAPAWQMGIFNFIAYLLLRSSANLTRMTVNSNALKEMYELSGHAPHCPVVAAHNGSQEFPLTETFTDWKARTGALQIGYAGHLYKGRGIEIILYLAEHLPESDFHIIGGNPEDISYWKNVTQLPNIFFHGFIPPSEVYKFRNTMDILLAPYPMTGVKTAGGKEDSSKYMNPIKVIEYMSAKKAIVASDLPPIREMLNENNSVLVESSSGEEWLRAIRELSNRALRERLAENAYGDFKRNLTWKARARKLLYGKS